MKSRSSVRQRVDFEFNSWSLTKQKELESQLEGFWADDIWDREECPIAFHARKSPLCRHLDFSRCRSYAIRLELKYVTWKKLTDGEWTPNYAWGALVNRIKWLSDWVNDQAPFQHSLLEKSVNYIECSFRTYIQEKGKLYDRESNYLVKSNEVRKSYNPDQRVAIVPQIYKTLQEAYDKRNSYEKDVWDLSQLSGQFVRPGSNYRINFSTIKPDWLKEAGKRFIKYHLATKSISTCLNKYGFIKHFSEFLIQHKTSIKVEEIDRALVLDYLAFLAKCGYSSSHHIDRISQLRDFLELSAREKWLDIPEKRYVFTEDYPKTSKRLPRYIPEDVIRQLNQHLKELPEDIFRLVLILQETGRRISEVLSLKPDCLKQDKQGDWFLQHYQFKMKKEDSIPITRELARVIQEQRAYVTNKYGKAVSLLFPSPKNVNKPLTASTVSEHLHWLAYNKGIKDETGNIFNFQSHQFRHTVGTNMLNSGVPIEVISRYLGHETLLMTQVYARLFDKTLKDKVTEFHSKVVNIAGEIMESPSPELENSDLQAMKKNILVQALPNGTCALPTIQRECPHANACLTCSNFRTTKEYLDQHKEQLKRTEEIIQAANEKGWTRVVEMNEKVATNLRTMIKTLEV